jgi:two-component system, chemotaxis family, chemotaxis protein CheY
MNAYRYDRLKVLVVDDNPHMRSLIGTVLLAIGVRSVLEASNADDGWEMLKTNSCDLVFVDWVMEGKSGLDFTQHLRTAKDSPNPFLPVIMLSSHTSVERVQAARDAGVNEFLAKPVSSKAVIDSPRHFVRTKSYFGPCRRHRDTEYHGPERRHEPGNTIDPRKIMESAA